MKKLLGVDDEINYPRQKKTFFTNSDDFIIFILPSDEDIKTHA